MPRDPWTLALDTSTTAPHGFAVKALPADVGAVWAPGSAGGVRWGSPPNASTYDFRQHSLPNNSVVSIALAWIRRNIHKGRYVVGNEEDDGTYTEVPHPLTMRRGPDGRRGLLRKPNPLESWRDTLGATSDSLSIDGNSYWLKARDGLTGEVAEVYWAPNHQIGVVGEIDPTAAAARGPVRHYWFTSGAVRRRYEARDVVHFRNGIDPLRRGMGLSPLKCQIRNGASVDFAERATSAVLRNLHSGGFLTPKESVGGVIEGSVEEEVMIRASGWIARQGGGEDLGRIPSFSLPLDYTPTGHNVDELGLQWILDWPVAMLLAAFGLNMLVLGLPGSAAVSTFANKAEAKAEAWENGVIPLQDLIGDAIEDQLLPDFPEPAADSCWVDRRDVEALQEDAGARVKRAVEMRGGPIASEDEARALVDLPPGQPGTGGDLTPVQEAVLAAQQARETAEAARAAAAAQARAQPPGEPPGEVEPDENPP